MNIDPAVAALVATITGVLTPYVQKGAEEFAQSAGKGAYEQAQKLLATLHKHFASDAEAAGNLTHFEEKPDRYRAVLEDILDEKLAQDSSLVGELQTILNELGPSLTIIQTMDEATNVTGLKAKNFKSGTVQVDQSARKAENMTGVELDGDLG